MLGPARSWGTAGVSADGQQWQGRWVQKKLLFQATGRPALNENAARINSNEQSMHAEKGI